MIILVIMLLFVEIVRVHPYEGSYFNEGVRFFIPENIENFFEVEYWGVTYRQGINWLNENAEPNSTICAPIAGHLIQYYDTRNDLTFSKKCSKDKDYKMFFTRKKWPYRGTSRLSPSFKISRYNSDLLYIYKLNNSKS